jgi:hypothetical protein
LTWGDGQQADVQYHGSWTAFQKLSKHAKSHFYDIDKDLDW